MREGRDYPFIDKKIITAWNAMMIKALFRASKTDAAYLYEAKRSYSALKRVMSKEDGSLFHQVLYGKTPSQEGLLEDYAFFADAALSAYETTLDKSYLEDAKRFSEQARKRFYIDGRWLLGAGEPRSYADISDSYYRSALSVQINNLISLAVLESSFKDEALARESLRAFGALINGSPDDYPEALRAYLRLEKGVVVVKSSRENLLKNISKIERIDYPFLLKSAAGTDIWQACDFKSCFAYSKNLDGVIEAIESR